MKYTKEVIQGWIDCIGEDSELTGWEEVFVDSVSEQLDRTGKLSDRQVEILERIYADKTP